jgi:hypothetical protein
MMAFNFNRIAAGVITVLALSACKEVQLYGPVEGASVSYDSLQNPGTESQSMTSTTRDEMSEKLGADKWGGWADWVKFAWIGNTAPNTDGMGDNVHYLVTAKYGTDSDAAFDHKMDPYPATVYGQWHAVASGRILKEAAFISVLTEASYQYLISQPDYNQMKNSSGSQFASYVDSKLSAFSKLVVDDVNDDGVVSVDDIFAWSNEYHRTNYIHDSSYLDQLADAIIQGTGADELSRLARQVYEGRAISGGGDSTPPNPFSKYDGVWQTTLHSATLNCANGNSVVTPTVQSKMRMSVSTSGDVSSVIVEEPPAPAGFRIISKTNYEHRIYSDGTYRSRGEAYAYTFYAGYYTTKLDVRGTFSNSGNMNGTMSMRAIYHDLAGECWGSPRATMVKVSP